VTICVAAICGGGIIGASDRMVTAGDIEFEPQKPKLYQFSSSIVAQIAGESSVQIEIIQQVARDVTARVKESPQDWWNVRDVVDLYSRYYQDLRLKHAEHDILSPLNLNRDTWLTKQREMDSVLVTNIAKELMNYDLPPTAVIFSGVDNSGAHIYVARDGKVSCQDSVGFAAIGAGEWHASSQLMFGGHTPNKPPNETLLLVFTAKKRAEVAPGVGQGTDMFIFGPQLGSYAPLPDIVIKDLEKIYKKQQKYQQKAIDNAMLEVQRYVEELGKRAVPETQTKKIADGGGNSSIDTPSVREPT
jgi:hypothetical protein